MRPPATHYADRGVVSPGIIDFVADTWSSWHTVPVPTIPRAVAGVAWLTPASSGAQAVQFAVGDAGSEVLVGPEFRHNGLVTGTRSVLFGGHVPLFVPVPGVRLAVRIKTASTVTGALNIWVHYIPVSRP